MNRLLLLFCFFLVLFSCDPAQTYTIKNDTDYTFTFSYRDPNSGDPVLESVEPGVTYSFYMMGIFPGHSLEDMKEFLGHVQVSYILKGEDILIAEGEEAVRLMQQALIKEDDFWIIYCSALTTLSTDLGSE